MLSGEEPLKSEDGMKVETVSATIAGVDGAMVRVFVDTDVNKTGLPISGNISPAAERETRVRVRSALAHASLPCPDANVHLDCAFDMRSGLDLAIAVALVSAVRNLDVAPSTALFGELSLTGDMRPVRGIIPMLFECIATGRRVAIIPTNNVADLRGVSGLHDRINIVPARTLTDVVEHLSGRKVLSLATPEPAPRYESDCDFGDVGGYEEAKRALEIAAAGSHNVLFVGSPGSGRTLLARRLPTVMPRPSDGVSQEICAAQSAAGLAANPGVRPFRAPHYTASEGALLGGGKPVRPGEVTLAHHGVLLLDELPEFKPGALESLVKTVTYGQRVTMERKQRIPMPARPLVVGSMTPCPCGWFGAIPSRSNPACQCSADTVERYVRRIARIRDFFPIAVKLPSSTDTRGPRESSDVVRARVERMRSAWPAAEKLDAEARSLLKTAAAAHDMSDAAERNVVAVARTIADLAGSLDVTAPHLAEALNYHMPARVAQKAA